MQDALVSPSHNTGSNAARAATLAECADALRTALAADPPALDIREDDARWLAALRDTTLYQCGFWLGDERICLLPHGHSRHTDEYTETRQDR
jgi:hypothetical protein